MASHPTTVSPTGKKLIQGNGGLRMINIIDEERSAFDIDECQWQNDGEHLICNRCGAKFSFSTRRHHCRRCGKIFCGSCCKEKVVLPRLGFVDPQRACTDCISTAKKEMDLYEKYIPILIRGADFEINNAKGDIARCKLNSRTNRDLLFSNPKDANDVPSEPVELQHVVSFQCLIDPLKQTQQGTSHLVGAILNYLSQGECKELKLSAANTLDNRKESLNFLLTLQKAMKMIFDSS